MRVVTALAVAAVVFTLVPACQQSDTPSAPVDDGVISTRSAPVHILTVGGFWDYWQGIGQHPFGNRATLTASARIAADGSVSGQLQFVGRSEGRDNTHGVIDCMTVVGNRAWVTGVFTSSQKPEWVGRRFSIGFEDNGDLAPGKWTGVWHTYSYCEEWPNAYFSPLDGGNVHIK